MHKQDSRCGDLIEKTAEALNDDTLALMLLAVQRGNLAVSVKLALNRWVCHNGQEGQQSHQSLQCLSL